MKFKYAKVALLLLGCNGCAFSAPGVSAGPDKGTAEAEELVAIMEQDFSYNEDFSLVHGGVVHYLKAGETVGAIAQQYHLNTLDLLEINNIKNPATLAVGTRIYIPATVAEKNVPQAPKQSENPPEELVAKPAESVPEQAAPVAEAAPQPQGRGMGTFRNLCWPVAGGQISSRFGQRWGRNHDGLDMPGPVGTPVRAAEAGEVILATFNEGGYGNLIIIKHRDNWFTVYAHNKRNLVKKGDKVKKCEQIAELGNTGRSTGPHSHFEVRQEKTPKDPLLFLEP